MSFSQLFNKPFNYSSCCFNAYFISVAKIPRSKCVCVCVYQLRPISYCNFIYKTISKVIVLRPKGFMEQQIPQIQTTFVWGRKIQDTLIISYEVFHVLKRRSSQGKMNIVIKLDMHKAYHRLQWGLL
jgi:hypothetical protein